MKATTKSVITILCVFLLWLSVSEAKAAFVSSQATVILAAGLPGDLESEKEYQDQLHSWLEFLASQPFAGRVIVLADSDLENPPARLSIEKHKATRENFLSLRKTIAASTNQTLVVAWGHGGTQGQLPVFHVRGPRLGAADFKSLADSFKTDSDWVLLFRGSGSFAKELAGPGRRILSSENETMYSSDPIAMAALIKIITTEPTPDFSAASEALGAAVTRWYEDRNLARTEQPTLWLGLENPRLLATDKSDLSKISATNQITVKIATTNLPSAWKEIRRVEAQQYPDDDAVALSRTVIYTLGNRPAISTDQEEFIQILTEEGKRFGDFDFHFAPPAEDIRFIDCEVLKPDGELVRLDPEAIRETAPSDLPDFGTSRRKFFSLPHVGPGAILHVHVQTSWQSFPQPHFSTTIPLTSETPIVQESVRVSIPRGEVFHFAFENAPGRDPELKLTEYGTSYLWKLENLPSHRREALSPPGAQPKLLISTFPDWANFSEWYARICQLSDEITPELSSKAAEVTREAKTDEEKLAAIFRYVTNLRYVAVEMGVNSFRPHAAANVLRNQYGDCKDKANLFNTLVRSLKIEGLDANLVLVPRFSQANEQTPGLAFNHAIAQVILNDKTYWVDTTDDVCRFGMLPPGDAGRKVLVIDGKSTSLTPLPQPLPRDHRVELRTHVKSATDVRDQAAMSVEVLAAGFWDYELRGLARESKNHSMNSALLAAKFRLANASFSLSNQSFSPVSALQTNFVLKMDGDLIGACAMAGKDQRALLRPPVWLPLEWEAALHRRTTGLFLNQGYPIQLDETIEWEIPGAKMSAPATQENKQGPLTWKLEWRQNGSVIIVQLKAELASGEITTSEVPLLQTQLRRMLSAVSAVAECELIDKQPANDGWSNKY